MPLIQVTLAAGRTPEQLHALGTALTDAAEQALGAPRETIRVVLHECEPEHWFVGGASLLERRANAAPPGAAVPEQDAAPGAGT
jgi:4-oxalocrotonate tautomerase